MKSELEETSHYWSSRKDKYFQMPTIRDSEPLYIIHFPRCLLIQTLITSLLDLGLTLWLNLKELEGQTEDRFLTRGIKDCTTSVIRGRYSASVCTHMAAIAAICRYGHAIIKGFIRRSITIISKIASSKTVIMAGMTIKRTEVEGRISWWWFWVWW